MVWVAALEWDRIYNTILVLIAGLHNHISCGAFMLHVQTLLFCCLNILYKVVI